MESPASPRRGGVIIPAPDLSATVDFFVELGLMIDVVSPADDPATITMSGAGLSLRLERGFAGPAPELHLTLPHATAGADGERRVAPGGTVVHLAAHEDEPPIPDLEPSFVFTAMAGDTGWGTGRAAMLYRDLIPGRLGGRFIASHIRIVDGGPVPDWVHHHHIRFQMIFCHAGWVDVVYEDQGPPFRLEAGDCVLQPPHIRHQVLHSSAGCEVVELGCPAIHDTVADREMTLPTSQSRPERSFGGQRFVRHVGADAAWLKTGDGWVAKPFGIAAATDGLAQAALVRPQSTTDRYAGSGAAEFDFCFVRSGTAVLDLDDSPAADAARTETPVSVQSGDAWVIPPGQSFTLSEFSADVELLHVTMPGPTS